MRRFLLLILLLPVVVIAQSDNTIAIGESITLAVTEDARANANFTVDAESAYITIEAQHVSDEIDPVIWLLDSDNHLLAYNDNFGSDTRARIDKLLLLAGNYTIMVDSFNGVSEGDIRLSLDMANPFEANSSQNVETAIISITLPADMSYHYMLELVQGDIVTFTVRDTSGTLDPYLLVMDSEATVLVTNDDHQSSDMTLNRLDSRISAWDVPEDGIYQIEVRDFLGLAGQFELTISIIP